MSNKLIAAGLFSVAVGLLAIAWSIHDQTLNLNRYQYREGARLDTRTGEIEICRPGPQALCDVWADPPASYAFR